MSFIPKVNYNGFSVKDSTDKFYDRLYVNDASDKEAKQEAEWKKINLPEC